MLEDVGKCEICGRGPRRPWPGKPAFQSLICVHEIARGVHRQRAMDKAYATLVVCGVCHEKLGGKAEWPEARQLAVLRLRRPGDFDLVAYNLLVNPNAPLRITIEEVDRAYPA